MGETHPATRPTMARGITILGLVVLGICVQLLLASRAEASPYTGGFSPTIIGHKADLNGNGAVGRVAESRVDRLADEPEVTVVLVDRLVPVRVHPASDRRPGEVRIQNAGIIRVGFVEHGR